MSVLFDVGKGMTVWADDRRQHRLRTMALIVVTGRQQCWRISLRQRVAGLAKIGSHVVVEQGTVGGAVYPEMNRSGYRVDRRACHRRVDVDEPEHAAQTEEREHNRLLEVDRVFVAAVVDDDAPRYGLVQRLAEPAQQERVVEAAARH